MPRLRAFEPEAVHISTEGPIGIATRRICVEWKLPFTTSYHTKFPEYVSARFPIPVQVGYAYMKWFHKPSGRLMVATPTLRDELVEHGFKNVSPWSRGVDTELFRPDGPVEERGRPFRVLTASRLVQRKGVGTTIAAVARALAAIVAVLVARRPPRAAEAPFRVSRVVARAAAMTLLMFAVSLPAIVKRRGARVDAWTLDADRPDLLSTLEALAALGVDQITSNDPLELEARFAGLG